MQKADVATDITTIKNDYVSNASLTSQLNNLTSQHIATEVTGVDNKTKKNASDILALENKLQQKEDTINENERRLSIFRGFFFYLQQNYLVYEIKVDSFIFDNKKILKWRSTSIFSYSDYYTNVINIYCVYKLDPIASTRDTTFIYKMLYLELCKLLKMLITRKIIIKDMVYVLMKEVNLVIQ